MVLCSTEYKSNSVFIFNIFFMVGALRGHESMNERVVNPNAVPAILQGIVESLYGELVDKDIRFLTHDFVLRLGKEAKNCIKELDRESIYFLMRNPRFFFQRVIGVPCALPWGLSDMLSAHVANWYCGVGELLVTRLEELDAEEREGGARGKDGQPCACGEVASAVQGGVSHGLKDVPL